jgi:hypothetical protein
VFDNYQTQIFREEAVREKVLDFLHSITGSTNSPLHVNENRYSSAKNTVIVDQVFLRKQAEETDESYVLLQPNRVTQKHKRTFFT